MRMRLSTPARSTGDTLTLALFALALCLPLGGRFLDPGADTSVLPELRNPAPAPRLPHSGEQLAALPERCEAWLRDRFGFRRSLVRGHNALKVFGFGVSPTDRAVMSSDLWVFTTVNQTFEAFRGTLELSEAELERWRVVLEARRDWLAARGITYALCFAPAKPMLYPERLPPGFRPGPRTPLEQLQAYLAEHSDFELIDLHTPLRAAKVDDREGDWLYYKLGSHWTERGGFVAARAVLESLRAERPDLHVPEASEYHRVPGADQGDNWAGRLHLEEVLRQARTDFEPLSGWSTEQRGAGSGDLGTRVSTSSEGPRLLLLHDSFGEGLWPVLAESFAHSRAQGSFELDPELVAGAGPDVIVQVMAERRLAIHRPQDTLGDARERAREAFEGSAVQLLVLAGGESLRGLAPWAGSEFDLPEGSASLALRCPSPRAGFQLPVLDLPELELRGGALPVLRLELTSPEETTLTVLYQTADRLDYLPSRGVHVPLAEGRNELFIEIPAEDLAGRLLVLPGRRRGRYLVHSIELRAPR